MSSSSISHTTYQITFTLSEFIQKPPEARSAFFFAIFLVNLWQKCLISSTFYHYHLQLKCPPGTVHYLTNLVGDRTSAFPWNTACQQISGLGVEKIHRFPSSTQGPDRFGLSLEERRSSCCEKGNNMFTSTRHAVASVER